MYEERLEDTLIEAQLLTSCVRDLKWIQRSYGILLVLLRGDEDGLVDNYDEDFGQRGGLLWSIGGVLLRGCGLLRKAHFLFINRDY